MATDYTIPAHVRRKLAGHHTAGWTTRGTRARSTSFGTKCRRCREYLPLGFVSESGLCSICKWEVQDSRDPDEPLRWGIPVYRRGQAKDALVRLLRARS